MVCVLCFSSLPLRFKASLSFHPHFFAFFLGPFRSSSLAAMFARLCLTDLSQGRPSLQVVFRWGKVSFVPCSVVVFESCFHPASLMCACLLRIYIGATLSMERLLGQRARFAAFCPNSNRTTKKGRKEERKVSEREGEREEAALSLFGKMSFQGEVVDTHHHFWDLEQFGDHYHWINAIAEGKRPKRKPPHTLTENSSKPEQRNYTQERRKGRRRRRRR